MSEGRYIKGGDGSHWEGCFETHIDCRLTMLESAIEEAKEIIRSIPFESWSQAGKWMEKYGAIKWK